MPILQPNATRIASGPGGFTDIYALSGADAIFDNLDVTGSLDVSGTITSGQAATFNGTTTVTRLVDASGVDAYFKVMNYDGNGAGIRADAATGITRIQPIVGYTTNGPGGLIVEQNGDVKEEGVFTVTRPAGDVTNDAFMSVQNAGGFGMGFRVAVGNVAPGATIERVTGTGGSGIADITLSSAGDVTFAQDVTIIGQSLSMPTGLSVINAPMFNYRGGNGSTCGKVTLPAGQTSNIVNPAMTVNGIVNLSLDDATGGYGQALRFTITPGIGFTIYNDDLTNPRTICYTVASYDVTAFGP